MSINGIFSYNDVSTLSEENNIKYHITQAIKELEDEYKLTLYGKSVFTKKYDNETELAAEIKKIRDLVDDMQKKTTLGLANITFEIPNQIDEDFKKQQLFKFLQNLLNIMEAGYKKIEEEKKFNDEGAIKTKIQSVINSTEGVDPVIKYQISNYNFLKQEFSDKNIPDPSIMRITLCDEYQKIQLTYVTNEINKEKCIKINTEFTSIWNNFERKFKSEYNTWKSPKEEDSLIKTFNDYLDNKIIIFQDSDLYGEFLKIKLISERNKVDTFIKSLVSINSLKISSLEGLKMHGVIKIARFSTLI
jgi:hypothetical protein